MKFLLSMVAVVGLGLAIAAVGADEKAAPKPADPELKDTRTKVSYGLGVSIGRTLTTQGFEIDTELFSQGLKDALGGKNVRLTDQQIQEAVVAYQQEIVAKKAKEGEIFLAENKKKDGVVALPSGLQYKVLKAGTGKTPKSTDTVTVNYEGRLIDKTVFDSSAKQGQPVSFQVGGVIKGFSEALQLMKVGSKWEVYIPSNLAYGASPPPGSRIMPNAPLIFDLELVDVKEGGK
jgi:FKBP-type peptidyl-prolyl cis-trans isomerase FklB